MMEDFAAGLAMILSLSVIVAMAAGTAVGILVGVLPGLGTVVALTMVLPFTFAMEPLVSIALLLGVYCGSVYGGSVTAILINAPGTPQSAATMLDGHPLARRGHADLALGYATVASLFGGLFSIVVLVLLAPQLAAFALRFGPIEVFALTLFSLTCIASVSRESMIKGLLAGALGIALTTVGPDPMTGDIRFNFGLHQLSAGIGLIPTLVGLFALSEVLMRVADRRPSPPGDPKVGFRIAPWVKWRGLLVTLLRGSTIGSFIGALPGTGAGTAAFVSYSEARRTSRRRENFGNGEPEGVVAAESANNAVTGGALIPTLALGIPGDPATAVMLSTLIVQGVVPGPNLFAEQMPLLYAIFLSLVVVNVMMFAMGALGSQLFTRALRAPEPVILVGIVVLSMVGSYAVRNNAFDLAITVGAGLLGYALRRNGFPLPPLAIGMVLGPLIETSLRQSLLISRGDILVLGRHPIALVLFSLVAIFLLWPVLRGRVTRGKQARSCR